MPTNEVIEMVGAVRREVGDDMRLMLDPNNGYDFRNALRTGHALDENDFHWFEDPVPWDDFRAIRILSEKLETPLNMSDSAQFLFHDAARVLEQGWPRTIRGTTRKIGITGLKKQCGMAEGFNVNCEIGDRRQFAHEYSKPQRHHVGFELRLLRVLDAIGSSAVRTEARDPRQLRRRFDRARIAGPRFRTRRRFHLQPSRINNRALSVHPKRFQR